MKPHHTILTVLLLFLTTKTFAQEKFTEFKKLLFKECPQPIFADSLRASNFIDSLHRALGVREVKIVINGTNSSHFAFGVMYIHRKAIDSGKIFSAWRGELTHAWQFSKKPIRTFLKASIGFVTTFINSYFTNESEERRIDTLVMDGCHRVKAILWVSYKRQYKKKRSFEGEAHGRIEPYLDNILRRVFKCY